MWQELQVTQPPRRIGFAILFILLGPNGGFSFTTNVQQHFLARRCNQNVSRTKVSLLAKPKSKRTNNSAKSKKPSKPNRGGESGNSPASPKQQPKKNSPTTNSRPSPPWQVMSAAEAKKNIAKENERRERARQGIQDVPADVGSEKVVLSKAFLSDEGQRFLKWKRFNPVTAPSGLRFVGSYLDRRLPPSLGVPEIAFLGRSNVGKSSLLNRLFAASSNKDSSSQEARVGKTPGATASVNLYALTSSASKKQQQSMPKDASMATKDILGFVDLPGFGYAKLSKETQDSVQKAAENYLEKRRELALGILLVDVRRAPPSDEDRAVLAALYDMGLPLLVVATKIDKVKSANEREQNLKEIQIGLGLPEGQPLAVSSVTGEGIKLLWNIILEACESSVAEFQKTYKEKSSVADESDDDDDDEELQPEAAFNDDEDLVYDQGYDWIHNDFEDFEDFSESDNVDDNDWSMYEDDDIPESLPKPTPNSLRNLKKRAKDFERRGEF